MNIVLQKSCGRECGPLLPIRGRASGPVGGRVDGIAVDSG